MSETNEGQVEFKRALASVKRIDSIEAIPEADSIEVAVIGGWKVVTRKGEFSSGDLGIFVEIDAFVPTALAPFLSKGKEPRVFNGVQGERLKTIRLRGQISQGLLIKPEIDPAKGYFWNTSDGNRLILSEGDDLTELLGILKWEAPEEFARNNAKGSFPYFIPKTDQERVQNLSRQLAKWKEEDELWEVTEKLDGSSMTVFFHDGKFGVCSRNLELKFDEEFQGTFWKAALALNLDTSLPNYCETFGKSLAIQGELIGPGIQKNPYGLDKHEFRVFDVFDIGEQKYWNPEMRLGLCYTLLLPHVPTGQRTLRWVYGGQFDMQSLLNFADGESAVGSVKAKREGIVFKNWEKPELSFKVISNEWLLGEK